MTVRKDLEPRMILKNRDVAQGALSYPTPSSPELLNGLPRKEKASAAWLLGWGPVTSPTQRSKFLLTTVVREQLVLIQRNLLTHCRPSSLRVEVFLALFGEKEGQTQAPHLSTSL